MAKLSFWSNNAWFGIVSEFLDKQNATTKVLNRMETLHGSNLSWSPVRFAGLFLLGVSLGCGGSTELPKVDDSVNFTGLVTSVQGAASSEEQLAQLFVAGSTPDAKTRKKYESHNFWVDSSEVTGGEATLAVSVTKFEGGAPVGTVQWTAAKENDGWKLKDAPLP